MKEIIDALTGEVQVVEDANEIATKKLFEVGAVDQTTFDFLTEYWDMEERYDTFRYILKKAMEENGIKKWDNELFSCSVSEETTATKFDTDRAKEMNLFEFRMILNAYDEQFLKETSIYDYFQKRSYVKSRINIRKK